MRRLATAALLAPLVLASLGCRQDMHDTPRFEAYEKTDFFGDGRAMRPQVEGTVARGQLREDVAFFTGKNGNTFLAQNPLPLTQELVKRGQSRYQVYCTPCHGLVGKGDGMIVRRGYKQPPSFHIDRLRQQPAGYYFDVMTNGFGTMPDYAAQLTVQDRWAVVAYLRALQLSQNATLADVPEAQRGALEAPTAAAPAPGGAH